MPTPEELKAIFKTASEIAAEAPEQLRELAFQRALDALLQQPLSNDRAHQFRSPASAPAATQRQRTMKQSANKESVVPHLLEHLDRSSLAHRVANKRVLDKALVILEAAHSHGIESMSPQDIATVLSQKCREATTAAAVRMALDRNPQYTDRRPEGTGYVYTLMAPGERYLAEPNDASSSPIRKAKTQRKSAGRKKATIANPSTTKHSPRATPKSRIKSSGRPGPKAMLEQLLAEGFFDSPKSMAETILYLQEKRAHRYSTSDLAPTFQRILREKKLTRSKNSQGQYEYSKE